MALYLATAAELAALPAGTAYKVYCNRPDLFGGKAVVGIDAKDITLAAAPATYPNGVKILDGAKPEALTVAAVKDPLPEVTDAEILKAVEFRKLTVSAAEVADG